MKLDVSAVSDVGCIRTRNEDMVLVKNARLRDAAADYHIELNASGESFLIALADGMGGHKGGAVASEIVTQEMERAVAHLHPGMPMAELRIALRDKIQAIHNRLNADGVADPEKRGMGSTFTAMLFYGAGIYTINIGDSRIYRYRNGILTQFTRDHSLSAMTRNPDAPKNILVNTFGAGASIFFDFDDITSRIIAGDLFLLCSDGLTNELADEEIEQFLASSADALPLVAAAKAKTGSDNISAVVIRFAAG